MAIPKIALAIASLGVSVISYSQQRRASKKAAEAAKDAQAQDLRIHPAGADIPIAYGRTALPGILVYPGSVGHNLPYVPNTNRIGGLRSGSGDKNEYLLTQYVLSVGEIEKVIDVWVNGRPIRSGDLAGLVSVEWKNGGVASLMATRFTASSAYNGRTGNGSGERTASDKFTGLSYLTAVARHDRDNPQIFGVPEVLAFVKARKVRAIHLNGSNYSLPAAESYTTNWARVLLDYITSTSYGPWEIDDGDIDLPSWHAAQEIAAQVVQGTGSDIWGTSYPAEFNTLHGTSFNNYSDYFRDLNFDDADETGWVDGPATPAADRPNILRHEYNGIVPTSRNFPDVLEQMLAVVPDAILFRSVTGKWKLSLGNPNRTAAQQSVMTIDGDMLLLDSPVVMHTPDSAGKLNSLTVNFADANKQFTRNSETWPKRGGTLDNKWLADDGGVRLHETIDMPGVNNRYAAASLAATTILLSRRPVYEIKTSTESALLEPGDVFRLRDPVQAIDDYCRVLAIRLKENLDVEIVAVQFRPADYAWQSDEIAVLSQLTPVDASVGTPASVTARARKQVVTVEWAANANEAVSVIGYQIQRSDDGGTTWVAAAQVDGVSRSWVTVADVDEIDNLRFRVRAITAGGRVSPWAQSNNVRVVAITGETAIREIIRNTGGTAVNVAGTDDIRINMSDGGFATLDMTTITDFVAAPEYPNSTVGKEGTTFALTQPDNSTTPPRQNIVSVWHKVSPTTWRWVGSHPGFADWFSSVGPPADFNFKDGADPDGTWWLESGAGRVWARVDGVWYWIFDLSSDGTHQVYGEDGVPADSDGEIGDRALNLALDAKGTFRDLRFYERGSAGWKYLGRLAGIPQVIAPLTPLGGAFVSGVVTRVDNRGSSRHHGISVVVDVIRNPDPRYPKGDIEFTSMSADSISVSSRQSGDLDNRFRVSIRMGQRLSAADVSIQACTVNTLQFGPQQCSGSIRLGVFQMNFIGGDRDDTSSYEVLFVPADGVESTLPPRLADRPTGGSRPAPANLLAVVPPDTPRYIDVDFDRPAGSFLDSDGNSLLLVGYEAQLKKASENWDGVSIVRISVGAVRPVRFGPGNYSTTYNIRIRAIYSDRGNSAWATINARTGAVRVAGPEMAGGAAPTGFTAVPVAGNLRYVDYDWTPPAGSPVSYEGEAKRSGDSWSTAKRIVVPASVSRPVRAGPGEYSTSYDARLRAVFANGNRSDWVETSFTTGAAPNEGTPPARQANGLYPKPLSFSLGVVGLFFNANWQPTDGYSFAESRGVRIVSYEGEIKKRAEAWSAADKYNAPASLQRPVTLGPGDASTTYDVRIRAIFEDGGVSDWATASATTESS